MGCKVKSESKIMNEEWIWYYINGVFVLIYCIV